MTINTHAALIGWYEGNIKSFMIQLETLSNLTKKPNPHLREVIQDMKDTLQQGDNIWKFIQQTNKTI